MLKKHKIIVTVKKQSPWHLLFVYTSEVKKSKRVQGVPQSQAATLPRYQEEEETDKTKQAQIEQTYKKH